MTAVAYEGFEKREVGEGYILIIYNFPEPAEVQEAAYGAVLLNRSTTQAEYYTLEKSFDGKWALASKTTTGNKSF